jgi:hypothetical protein
MARNGQWCCPAGGVCGLASRHGPGNIATQAELDVTMKGALGHVRRRYWHSGTRSSVVRDR